MDKSQLIEKIAKHFGVQDSEQKLFFEIFLRKCSETLDATEFIQVGEIAEVGKLEDRKAQGKETTYKIAIITNLDEFLFDIPEEDKEIHSIDSYFSISIGKPIIPLKENDDLEFFIPHSGNEMNRMFELKVGRFIEDARKEETGVEAEESELDFSDNLQDVNFSFNNWKSSSDSETELTEDKIEEEKTENDLSEIQTEENNLSKETKGEDNIEEQVVNDSVEEISDEIPEEIESQLEEVTSEIEEVPRAVEEITEEMEVEGLNEDENTKDELKPDVEQIESSEIDEESLDEQIKETGKNLESNDESADKEKHSETDSDSVPVSEEDNIDDKQLVMDAVKYAEEKDERLENYRKKSYGGFIFAIVVVVIIGVVIFFAYYLTNADKAVVQKSETPKQFAATVERTYDIPVTYPYKKGMMSEAYNAINDEVLNESGDINETLSSDNGTSGKVEIRSPQPAARVKGYIYKYENMYAVQVSSWKSKSIAISEGQKFLDAGYNAFIEQTELNDKGTYYRVRVGGFGSLEEAENFLKK